MALLVATTAYPNRPLGHLRLMISFLLSEFCSFPQASNLCSQISGVFYCDKILFKCLYSPKPKSSNYPRKKAFVLQKAAGGQEDLTEAGKRVSRQMKGVIK